MKKVVLAAALLMAANAQASNGIVFSNVLETKSAEMYISKMQNLKFRVVVTDMKAKSEVILENAQGEVFFSEYVSREGVYAKQFDLSNLADGKYRLVVRNGNEVKERTIEIATSVQRVATF